MVQGNSFFPNFCMKGNLQKASLRLNCKSAGTKTTHNGWNKKVLLTSEQLKWQDAASDISAVKKATFVSVSCKCDLVFRTRGNDSHCECLDLKVSHPISRSRHGILLKALVRKETKAVSHSFVPEIFAALKGYSWPQDLVWNQFWLGRPVPCECLANTPRYCSDCLDSPFRRYLRPSLDAAEKVLLSSKQMQFLRCFQFQNSSLASTHNTASFSWPSAVCTEICTI